MEDSIPKRYAPVVVDIGQVDKNIMDAKTVFTTTKTLAYPKFEYGFHQEIYETKNKLEGVNMRKVRNVLEFEHKGEDEITIEKGTRQYLKLTHEVMDRAFYKMWELIMLFNLIPEEGTFVSAHMAEGPGAFIQATITYRDNYAKTPKNDKYYGITLYEEGSIKFKDSFTQHYEAENPRRYYQYREDGKTSYGDLTQVKTLDSFQKFMGKERADLVTADGGFKWKDENLQEQEAFMLVLGQIIGALKVQKKGGHFVLKIFESYTVVTAKLIYLLGYYYRQVFVTKPLTSRKSNSEKYIVCLDFLSDKPKYVEKLEAVLEDGGKLEDVFLEFNLPNEYVSNLTRANNRVKNNQMSALKKILEYSKNEFKMDEHKIANKRQKANEFWIQAFLPSCKADLKTVKTNMEKFRKAIAKHPEI